MHVQCENCGTIFNKKPAEIAKTQRHFCSMACFGKWQSNNRTKENHPSYNQVDRTCETCGNHFTATPSEVKKGWAKYCSRTCYDAAGHIERTCAQCGITYTAHRSQHERYGSKFCCKACYAAWQKDNPPAHLPPAPVYGKDNHAWRKVVVNCDNCGREIERTPYRLQKLNHHFCNAKCMGEWRSNNIVGEKHPLWKEDSRGPSYGPNWYGQRKKVRSRANYCCQHCGISEKKLGKQLDVHHLIPFRTFNGDYKLANRLDNLIALCNSCHKLAEHGKIAVQPNLL